MSLAELLGRSFSEVSEFPPGEMLMWRAWAAIQREDRERAEDEARSRRSR
jgi:hypothetical protein